MPHQITISDETFSRLRALAEPFVDRDPEDVIRRLLDQNDRPLENGKQLSSPRNRAGGALTTGSRSPSSRVPRERGATVQIGDHTIEAVSVRDLYEQALRLFVKTDKSRLQAISPLKTSAERYLLAQKPVHPNGKHFFIQVEFGGFFMEAHKDYRNAIEHLRTLVEKMGLTLKYLG